MEPGLKFLEFVLPMQDTLCCEAFKSEIAMIGVDMYVGTEQHGTEFFKGSDNGEHLFLSHGIILLCTIKLFAVIGNRSTFLHDARTHLIVGCISVDFEPFVVIWVSRERICCH